MGSRDNVVFLTGPSDLLMFMAGQAEAADRIADWTIVLIGTPRNIPAAMIDVCRTMAGHDDVGFLDFAQPEARDRLLDRIGRRFDQVAISHLYGRHETDLLAALRWESLTLTENGIATYLPPPGRTGGKPGQPLPPPRFLPDRAILPLSAHPGLGLPSYLSGQARLELRRASPAILHDLARALWPRLAADFPGIVPQGDWLAVVGTSLSRSGAISEAAEHAAHASALAAACARVPGGHVLWKPHPRSLSGLPGPLPEGVRVLSAPLPLELLLCVAPGRAEIRSIGSSALLSAQVLCGLPAQILPAAIDAARVPHVALVRRLVENAA